MAIVSGVADGDAGAGGGGGIDGGGMKESAWEGLRIVHLLVH